MVPKEREDVTNAGRTLGERGKGKKRTPRIDNRRNEATNRTDQIKRWMMNWQPILHKALPSYLSTFCTAANTLIPSPVPPSLPSSFRLLRPPPSTHSPFPSRSLRFPLLIFLPFLTFFLAPFLHYSPLWLNQSVASFLTISMGAVCCRPQVRFLSLFPCISFQCHPLIGH